MVHIVMLPSLTRLCLSLKLVKHSKQQDSFEHSHMINICTASFIQNFSEWGMGRKFLSKRAIKGEEEFVGFSVCQTNMESSKWGRLTKAWNI